MTRGMYAAAGGMLVGLTKQDVLANNLANANTPGFKVDRISYGSFQKVLLPKVPGPDGRPAAILQSATLNATEVDLRPGGLHQTGSPMDVGIEGRGWLVVQTPEGERYTRNGHLARATDGTLITSQGYPVLGLDGPVRIASDEVVITEDGELVSEGRRIGQLRMVRFTDPSTVTKHGDGLYGGGSPVPSEGSRIRQGWLESSNTDTMRIMVEMIGTMRGFEMNQRVIQAQDQTLQQTIDTLRR